MHRSEPVPAPAPSARFDWRGWLMLGWAGWFGLLYASMVVERKGPVLAGAIRAALGLAGR